MSHYLAPNGKPSNLTHEQWHLVRTPEFKAWFGDWENDPANASKVVDANGEPLVVYHGTNSEFFTFEPSKPNFYQITEGTYFFTDRKSVAENFGSIVLPVFLQIDNPTYLDGRNSGRFNTWTLYDDESNYGFIVNNSDTGGGISTEYAVEHSNQIKLADGTNTTFDGSNPDIRYDDGGRVEDLIGEGIVDLKMYDTTPEHAKEYGLQSINPLYIQTICVSEPKRLKGLGKKVLAYIEKYAIENGHDVVFGHITQKAKFTKDERETFFCDIDMIKNWLHSNGYAINDNNNDFHKVISYSNPDIRYNNGGTMKKVDKGGITYGNSHDNGGIPVKNASTGQMLEVEGGEGIVNKRSMASDKKVKMNGKEMTICEAVSHLNQMEGGVRFSCDDVEHRQFIEQMELGGELERGKRTEKEHIDTLIKLYEKKLTPNQAITKIAKEHIAENPTYYTDLSKMNKEEKRAHIAELKKKFVEKAKHGTKVKDGDAPVYPKMNKYTGFFDTMSKYQDEYKKAVSAHEKTVTEGLRVKEDKKMPKKEKEAKLETLRQELIQDKTRLKEARKDLAKLPEMESPFYAPKLAEGGQIEMGQIPKGYSEFITATEDEGGTLAVKPIRDDVAKYNLPKTGFIIDYTASTNGERELRVAIGKRSLNFAAFQLRNFKTTFENSIFKQKFNLKIYAGKSVFYFSLVIAEDQDRVEILNAFINFLRYANEPKTFLDNYDPTTQSVYRQEGGQQQQEEIREPLAIIANAISDEIKNLSKFTTGGDTFQYLRILSNLSNEKQEQLVLAFVKWKKAHPEIDSNYKPIYELMHTAKDLWNLENSTMGVQTAFETSNSSFAKYINETLRKNLYKTSVDLRRKFMDEFKNFSQTSFAKYWLGNTYIKQLLDAETATAQALYFLYLLKK